MPIGIVSHPDCALHEMGPMHPEQPARLSAIRDRLVASGLDHVLRHYEAPLATREQLLRVHGEAHVDHIFDSAPKEGLIRLDPDTAMNPHSLPAALRAAGSTVLAVEKVVSSEVSRMFCSVRPPGHHAERDRAMGFCLFNNVAVGAAHAMAAHGLERIGIVDFDVHHGNGTEDIFRSDRRVMFCSSFQHPFYPFSGAESPSDRILNLPLPGGSGGEVFRKAVEEKWLPALDAFKPQFVFFSAGFDAHAEDAMSGLSLTESDYAWVTSEVRAIADRHANGRVVSVLEGGYDLSALGRGVEAHLRALL
jgi:acetoin utilization deacetylase AcuC-like enzyme